MKTAYELAQDEIGTFEWADGSNPKVLAYFKDAGHGNISDDAVPWCAAFVGAMLERSGVHGTGKLNARSYLTWGKPVEERFARHGDVCIKKRGTSAWQGHVFFYVSQTETMIYGLGGNQSDAVNIQGFRKSEMLGIRRGPRATKPEPDKKPDIWAAIIAFILSIFGGKK